ncbi:MAG: plasmid mobilization protein [Hyphomicrobiales bacterium]
MLNREKSKQSDKLQPGFGKAAKSDRAKTRAPSPLTIRLTAEERSSLKRRADENELSLSAYVRSCVFKTAGQRKNYPAKDRVELARLLGLLGQSEIADNLNVLADEATCGSLLFDDQTQAKIQAAYEHVCFMRESLIAVLGLRETASK